MGGPSSRTCGSRWRRKGTHIDRRAHRPRIAAQRAHVDDRGAFGIRPEPAAAIARRCGGQTRRAPWGGRMWRGQCDGSYLSKTDGARGSQHFGMRQGAANCGVVGERLHSTLSGHSWHATATGRNARERSSTGQVEFSVAQLAATSTSGPYTRRAESELILTSPA